MKCPALETLSSYLEGELPAADAALLAVHLSACPRCRAEAAALTGIIGELGALRECDFSAADQERLLSEARSSALGPAPAPQTPWRPAASLVLALLLSFGAGFLGYGLYQRSSSAVPPENALQALLSEHQDYEALAAAAPELSDFNVQVAATR